MVYKSVDQKQNNRHFVTCYVISMVYTLIDHSSRPISVQGFAQLLYTGTWSFGHFVFHVVVTLYFAVS